LAEPYSSHGVVSRERALAGPVLYDLPRFFGHVYYMKSCWLARLELLLALGDLTPSVAQAMDGIFTMVFEHSTCFLFSSTRKTVLTPCNLWELSKKVHFAQETTILWLQI